MPPLPDVAITDPDAAAREAIEKGVAALADLRSFQFTADIVGIDARTITPSTFDFGLKGTIGHENGLAMDAQLGSRIREPNGSAVTSGGSRLLAANGLIWQTDNVSEVLEPSPVGSVEDVFSAFAPEGLATRLVVPYAGGYARVGSERRGGVAAVRYRASKTGSAAYRKAFQFPGKVEADLWLTADGGRLLEVKIRGTGSVVDPATGAKFDIPLLVRIAITHPNDAANVVELPVPPIPDPLRPSEPPVDLHLEYRVLPGNGRAPTEDEVNEMGVALRTRLDVSTRRVKLDVIGNREIVITLCHTTQPDADRRLIQARGELTVVPLPASDYGSTTRQGPRGLPAVGDHIDHTLEPIAPPSRLGLTTAHVDPTNGQRGLAFMLPNDASETFRTYASAHRDEYVAVVLDGVVLAVLPIDDRTARGHFVFTGDYTEAESRSLARWLYRDPLPYDLDKTMDVEFASR